MIMAMCRDHDYFEGLLDFCVQTDRLKAATSQRAGLRWLADLVAEEAAMQAARGQGGAGMVSSPSSFAAFALRSLHLQSAEPAAATFGGVPNLADALRLGATVPADNGAAAEGGASAAAAADDEALLRLRQQRLISQALRDHLSGKPALRWFDELRRGLGLAYDANREVFDLLPQDEEEDGGAEEEKSAGASGMFAFGGASVSISSSSSAAGEEKRDALGAAAATLIDVAGSGGSDFGGAPSSSTHQQQQQQQQQQRGGGGGVFNDEVSAAANGLSGGGRVDGQRVGAGFATRFTLLSSASSRSSPTPRPGRRPARLRPPGRPSALGTAAWEERPGERWRRRRRTRCGARLRARAAADPRVHRRVLHGGK